MRADTSPEDEQGTDVDASLARRAGVDSVDHSPVPAPSPSPASRSPLPAPCPSAEAGQRPTETVRVDIDRLDHLMDLAGQLVINKAQFVQIGDKFRSVLACKHSEQALNKVSTELERMGGQIALRLDGEHSAAVLEGIRATCGGSRTSWSRSAARSRPSARPATSSKTCSKRSINWGASATGSSRA